MALPTKKNPKLLSETKDLITGTISTVKEVVEGIHNGAELFNNWTQKYVEESRANLEHLQSPDGKATLKSLGEAKAKVWLAEAEAELAELEAELKPKMDKDQEVKAIKADTTLSPEEKLEAVLKLYA